MQQIESLYIAPSSRSGRGVFTAASIPGESLIEICPMIVLKPSDNAKIDETDLFNYYFLWGENEELYAIALGYGSLYNHSFQPNARYLADFDDDTLKLYTLRDIKAGEELTINYNGLPGEQDPVWFDPQEPTISD